MSSQEPNAFIVGARERYEATFDMCQAYGEPFGVGAPGNNKLRVWRTQDEALRWICDAHRMDLRVYGLILPHGWEQDVTEFQDWHILLADAEIVRLPNPAAEEKESA